MHTLVSADVDFKIAPPESLSIIGSNSIDTAGDLYIIDVNSISKPKTNVTNGSLMFSQLAAYYIFTIFNFCSENKTGFIKNIFAILFGFNHG